MDQNVLAVYIDDQERKLEIFDALAERVSLFKQILNSRLLYKRVSVDKDRGFEFHTTSGDLLSPENLSSGEQHEVVLLYFLLFIVEPNSLILIDEPELSLHIAWQMKFLDDLQQITQLSSFDVLIATHSPEIIGDRWNLTIELSGPADA